MYTCPICGLGVKPDDIPALIEHRKDGGECQTEWDRLHGNPETD